MENKQTIVRQILQNEFSWIVFIVVTLWGFISTVVLPLQAVQINVAKIQEQLLIESTKYGQWEARLGLVEKNQAVVLERLRLK